MYARIKGVLLLFISLTIFIRNLIINRFNLPIERSNRHSRPIEKSIQTTFDNHTSRELYSAIEQYRSEFGIPSIQVSINTKEEGVFNCSTGYSNVEKKDKATVDTVFYLGSLTKLYTHALILKLVQNNVISLDDLILNYIDIFPNGKNVKIKHLLYHSSGLFDHSSDQKHLFKTYFCGKKSSYNEIIEMVRKNKPYFEPGEERRYSNTGYILLGIIAERVTNKLYSHLLELFFFKEFNLNNTYYSYQNELPNKLATGYDEEVYRLGKIGLRANVDHYPIYLPTANFTSGGLVASSAEVSRFICNLFETDVLNNENKRKLRLFFSMSKYESETLRTYGGLLVGYNNFMGYSSSKKFSVVALSNLSSKNSLHDDLINKIIKILINNDKI